MSVKEGKSSSSSASLECDVALGLKVQSPSCDGDGNGNGGGAASFFGYTRNPIDNTESLPRRSFHSTDFSASSGGMAVSGKAVFTATQWQELERQQMIHKYMMASVPVPPQLLSPSFPSLIPQSNTAGLDLRFSSSGSDPEPWRCKRTDGKKWRCSRDVAPDQKYCDRHAHKSRPRSRKPVEASSHNSTANLHAPSCDQSRGGNSRNSGVQQWQQLIQTNKDNLGNMSEYPRPYEDKLECGGGLQRFEIGNRFPTRIADGGLSLSIPGEDSENGNNLMSQWMNPWVHYASNPGGPLGEALCLGNASVTRVGSNLASPHSSKSSCEDGGHAFNFIG